MATVMVVCSILLSCSSIKVFCHHAKQNDNNDPFLNQCSVSDHRHVLWSTR
jgi:hypothetical protein